MHEHDDSIVKAFQRKIATLYTRLSDGTLTQKEAAYILGAPIKKAGDLVQMLYKKSAGNKNFRTICHFLCDYIGCRADLSTLENNSWHDNWATLSTYFNYPEAVRRLIYTTNAFEGFHRQLRKITKLKTVFPTDDSPRKMLYLAKMDITKKWTGHRQVRSIPSFRFILRNAFFGRNL